MNKIVEVCCGSYYDAKQAFIGGAKRIELNSALYLGGLTPSISALELVKNDFELNVISMSRPRAAGFLYNDEDTLIMFEDARALLKRGSDGIAFGFLTRERKIDEEKTKRMVDIIKNFNQKKEAVFHRAFDCVINAYENIEKLIDIGIDRVLTSGLENKAIDGVNMIKNLQKKYGEKIEILVGSGINYNNVKEIILKTGINQVHSSCKNWVLDETTSYKSISYNYASLENKNCYEAVSSNLVKKLIENIKGI